MPNTNNPGLPIKFGCPEYDDLHRFSMKVDIHEQINTFHVNAVDQNELASSSENKIPPTGAPNAAATPAAAPPLTKLRLSLSFLNTFNYGIPKNPANFGT